MVLSTPEELLSGIAADDELQKITFDGGMYIGGGTGFWKTNGK